MKTRYYQVNQEPIEIHYRPNEDDMYNYQASFDFNGCTYWLRDFIRTKDSPWVSQNDFPDFIDAYQGNEYYFPLFIQLIGDTHLNVYIHQAEE